MAYTCWTELASERQRHSIYIYTGNLHCTHGHAYLIGWLTYALWWLRVRPKREGMAAIVATHIVLPSLHAIARSAVVANRAAHAVVAIPPAGVGSVNQFWWLAAVLRAGRNKYSCQAEQEEALAYKTAFPHTATVTEKVAIAQPALYESFCIRNSEYNIYQLTESKDMTRENVTDNTDTVI